MASDLAVHPYTISVPEKSLDTLKAKLDLATFPDELSEAEWDYGAPLQAIKHLTTYWQETFDWRAQETKINNDIPQFMARISVAGFEVLDIHFVHLKSGVDNAIPLLFVHGCMWLSFSFF